MATRYLLINRYFTMIPQNWFVTDHLKGLNLKKTNFPFKHYDQTISLYNLIPFL